MLIVRDAKVKRRRNPVVFDASPKLALSYIITYPFEARTPIEVTNEEGLTLANQERVCLLSLLFEISQQLKIGMRKTHNVTIKHTLRPKQNLDVTRSCLLKIPR